MGSRSKGPRGIDTVTSFQYKGPELRVRRGKRYGPGGSLMRRAARRKPNPLSPVKGRRRKVLEMGNLLGIFKGRYRKRSKALR